MLDKVIEKENNYISETYGAQIQKYNTVLMLKIDQEIGMRQGGAQARFFEFIWIELSE